MKFKTFEAKDFKNIKHVKIDSFGDLNLICGETGQGKTALVEAFTFMLTGFLKEKSSEYIRWFQDKFEIIAVFEHLSKEYEYRITGTEKGFKRSLKVSGEKMPYKNSDAVTKMKEIVNPVLALFSAVGRQGKISELLFETGAKRLEKFKQLFGLERLDLVGEDIKADIDINKQKIETLKTEISVMEEKEYKLEEEPTLPMSIEEMEDYIEQDKQFEIDKIISIEETVKLKQYEKDLQVYNDAKKEEKRLQESVDRNRFLMDELNKSIEEVPEFTYDLDATKTTIMEKTVVHTKMVNDLDNYHISKKSNDSFKIKVETDKKQIDDFKVELKRVPRVDFTEEELEADEEILKDKAFDYKQQVKKYEAIMNGECPTCGNEFTTDTLQDEEAKKGTLFFDFIQLKEKVDKRKVLVKRVDQIEKDNAVAQASIDGLVKVVKEREKQIEDFENLPVPLFDSANKFLDEINVLHAELITQKKIKADIDKLKDENDKVTTDMAKILVTITVEDNERKLHERVVEPVLFICTVEYKESEHQWIKDCLKVYIDVAKELVRIQKSNDKILKQQVDNISAIDIKRTEIEILSTENRKLADTRTLITKEFTAWLIDKGTTRIKNKMNEFFQKSYDKYVITLKQEKNSVDFFYGLNADHQVPVNMASGHEENTLAIAFRKALCSLQPLNFMILDELDCFASDKMSSIIFKTLLERSRDQFFVITHNENTKSLLEAEYRANIILMENGKNV